MIKLTLHGGSATFLKASEIAQITEADTPSRWHGINSIVRTLEIRECAEHIHKMVQAEEE